MSMSLYVIDLQIKETIDSLMDSVDENGEISDAELLGKLNELKEARETKLENIALYAKNLAVEASAIKNEENTLAERRKRLERKQERLEAILISAMKADGNNKIFSPRFEAVIRDSKKTNIINESLIPKEYMNVKTTTTPDKTAIKKAIEAGKKVAGAELVANSTITIK